MSTCLDLLRRIGYDPDDCDELDPCECLAIISSIDVLDVLESVGCSTSEDVSAVAEKIARLLFEDLYQEEYVCSNGKRIVLRRSGDGVEIEVLDGPIGGIEWGS